MKNNKRRRVTVDPRIQGAIAVRVALYWILCILSIAVVAAGGTVFGRHELWNEFSRIGTLAFLPLPLVLLDVLIFSNRLAGPIYRIRKSLDEFGENGRGEKIALRKGDFFEDVAESFNRAIDRVSEDASAGESKAEPATAKDSAEREPMEAIS